MNNVTSSHFKPGKRYLTAVLIVISLVLSGAEHLISTLYFSFLLLFFTTTAFKSPCSASRHCHSPGLVGVPGPQEEEDWVQRACSAPQDH